MNKTPLLPRALFALLALTAPATAPAALFDEKDETILWRSGANLYFKYAAQDSDALGPNSHPVILDATRVTQAMQALQYWKSKRGSSAGNEQFAPVFSTAQARLLGEYLAVGLRGATPGQDIVFVMERSEKKLLGLATDYFFVAGRAFHHDGKLNLIIGDYDKAREKGVEAVYDPTNVGITTYSFNHGSRKKKSNRFKRPIYEVPGISNMERKKLRPDWILIDVDEAAAAYVARKVRDNPEQEYTRKAIKQEADKSARERREMRLELARMRKEMQKMNGAQVAASAEERLKALQDLREKELVTEEEYRAKRKEILDDI